MSGNGKYLITGGLVVTLDDSLGDYENGAILIEDGVIKAVGRAEDISAPGAEVIDASEGVVIPGFVDSHRHLAMSLMRGISIDQNIWPFLIDVFTRFCPAISVEDMHMAGLIGGLEAIESGTTTIMNPSDSMNSVAHAAAELQGLRESGIRGYHCYGMGGGPYGDVAAGKPGWEARMQHAKQLIEEDSASNLLRVGVHLSMSSTVPFSWIKDEIQFAHALSAFTVSHSSTLRGTDFTRDLEIRADMDVMLPGHLYIHCTNVLDHEMASIAATRGALALTPDPNIQTGMGYPPLRQALAHGLHPALSTDSSCTTPPDMMSAMRLQLATQRSLDHAAVHSTGNISSTTELVARDALIWGTRNGAAALGLADKIGTLTPGKRADIVVITNKRRLSATANPLGTAVMHASTADVDLVMVDGKIRKRDGQLVGIDVADVKARARQAWARIRAKMENLKSDTGPEALQEFIRQTERNHRVNTADAYR
ncbi:hypothetical protein IAQ61_007925 [Plenodomus lingam]|uniref:Similar to amidohydrolase n=1 Tax=Leptosphaeria maculans (strain JN3 / isolate v23.1.3 / race Av1-4-5-6-7-8) TaxID=985895 RepID=E4ZZM1_LEPMJ|nr:similar to amidohydrolase [Plenodomus lingam JN3]KAH9867333.1 hypothetical protein IAQ61_007925 [Plenodomus lingam]CBX97137.1 similar to amidohydrolase [Plenodomus lingam JN3]